jgi:GT2 family glycosyltransferase
VERLLFAPRALPPLRPSVAEDPTAYSDWITQREAAQGRLPTPGMRTPNLTILIAVDGEPPPHIVPTIQSLGRQTNPGWNLVAVVQSQWRTNLTAMVSVSGVQHMSKRVQVLDAPDGSAPAAQLQIGLDATAGCYVSPVFPGDIWAPSAVDLLGAAMTPNGVVYADEDRISSNGVHSDPRLKPTFSPEFLLHSFYVGRPVVLGPGVVDRLPHSETGTDLEHDLVLRATEVAQRIDHIPEVLCHRMSDVPEPSAHPDGIHIASALRRQGIEARVTKAPHNGLFRIARAHPEPTLTSIIIPFRDEPQLLRACVESIDETTDGSSIEFILVDNGSSQPESASLIDRLARRRDTRILSDPSPFNWAALNNLAAIEAAGDVLLFMNNDIEARRPGWLSALVAQAMRPEVAVVGARLLYPDLRVQHCGVVLGLGGAAGHILSGLEKGSGYLGMAAATRECAAVTGACFATRRDVFTKLDGFDTSLGIDLNDIDYCLRAQRLGMRVIFEADAELIHHESPSRGTAGDTRDIIHFIERWEASILDGDPYLHPALTRRDSSCALRSSDERAWWDGWRATLSRPQ